MGDTPISVVVMSSNTVLAEAIGALLASDRRFVVSATCPDHRVALQSITHGAPDVVLYEVFIPQRHQVDVIRQLCAHLPRSRVVVMVDTFDSRQILDTLAAGARAVLPPNTSREQVFDTLETVHRDGFLLTGDVASSLVQMLLHAHTTNDYLSGMHSPLTSRESEVIRILAHNRTTADIARTLGISAKTVRNHISNIYAKLGVNSRFEIVMCARYLLDTSADGPSPFDTDRAPPFTA
jgi:DNA-binding NarL/FixJ family response regulator